MRLELGTFPIEEVVFADRTALDGRRLVVDRDELVRQVQAEGPFTRVGVELAHPGESVRIIHGLDLVEPRAKASGRGAVFPGILAPPETVGQGRTNRLSGLAIVQTGWVDVPDEATCLWDSIIDLSGPGAALYPYADLIHLVLELDLPADLAPSQWSQAMRRGALRAAAYLAETTREQQPASLDVYDLTDRPASRELPTVVYIRELMTFNPLHDQIHYGRSMTGVLPVAAHPNELMDGAVVCSNGHFACHRNTTYLNQNDPVVRELYRLHGSQINFAGLILAPGYWIDGADKERSAAYSARLARLLGADGAILTVEGGGHGVIDVMLTCQKCEQLGIKTVIVINEMHDPARPDSPVPDSVPEANAIVSTGNREETVRLPAVDRVLGGQRLRLAGFEPDFDPHSSFEVLLRHVFGSTNQVGAGKLRGFEI